MTRTAVACRRAALTAAICGGALAAALAASPSSAIAAARAATQAAGTVGIQYAISHGSLVVTVRQAGVPRSVATYLLCGGAPTLPGFYNENRGPSDGVVFIASCQDATGIASLAGSRLISGDNHLMLGWEASAEATVAGWLG
jgi:hypothetical protein